MIKRDPILKDWFLEIDRHSLKNKELKKMLKPFAKEF